MDYEVQRCTRHCAATERELKPGEDVFSVLLSEGGKLIRHDYSTEAWHGPPEGSVGWWKSQIPRPDAKRVHWAPNDVMLQFFEDLEAQPARQDMRYVLALLLVRRRVMRMEEESREEQGRQTLVLYCPRREATFRVAVVPPDESRIEEIQQELAGLLFSRAS
jgi:hypothetical protein